MVFRRNAILLVLVAVIWILGCRSEPESAPEERDEPRLMLFCGAGIQLPVSELVEAFNRSYECRIDVDYAGSEILWSRIKLKEKGDLYMPGDQSYVDMAEEAGMIESKKIACYFIPAILVAKGNPKHIAALRDLTRVGIRLGLGDANACAIGRQSRKVFAKNSIPWANVGKNLVFQSMTVNELGMQIQTGSLDAVIVWDAVAEQYLDHGELVAIPLEQNIISTVPVGVLSFSRHKSLAGQFAEFAASDNGRAIFRKHHYRVVPPLEGNY
jgi:molybdate transport system substrate-binding protein